MNEALTEYYVASMIPLDDIKLMKSLRSAWSLIPSQVIKILAFNDSTDQPLWAFWLNLFFKSHGTNSRTIFHVPLFHLFEKSITTILQIEKWDQWTCLLCKELWDHPLDDHIQILPQPCSTILETQVHSSMIQAPQTSFALLQHTLQNTLSIPLRTMNSPPSLLKETGVGSSWWPLLLYERSEWANLFMRNVRTWWVRGWCVCVYIEMNKDVEVNEIGETST